MFAARWNVRQASSSSARSPVRSYRSEAIHLGSAFQLAGFRHTIATLWPVGDRATGRVAEDFYRQVDPHRPASSHDIAFALHAAVRRARDTDRFLPTNWAPLVHTGP